MGRRTDDHGTSQSDLLADPNVSVDGKVVELGNVGNPAKEEMSVKTNSNRGSVRQIVDTHEPNRFSNPWTFLKCWSPSLTTGVPWNSLAGF
jgi:hypothetical protein